MPTAAYLARHAFMVGSDGAAQVSKPAMAAPGPVGVGVGVGVGGGVGVGDRLDHGVQPGGSPLGVAVTLGQAGFVAWARFAASTTTGCLVTRIESPARWVAPCWFAPCWFAPCWNVASICSAVPGSVP